MQKQNRILVLVTLVAGLWACGPKIVPSSGPRPATFAAQVKIYQKEPSQYERLGTITHQVTSTTQWLENADATPAFNDLLTKAGALGANGLLLMDNTNASTVMAGARFKDKYYLVPVKPDPKTVIVQAIYVVEE